MNLKICQVYLQGFLILFKGLRTFRRSIYRSLSQRFVARKIQSDNCIQQELNHMLTNPHLNMQLIIKPRTYVHAIPVVVNLSHGKAL